MASNKKPKKKYVPKDIRYPSLVTQINSFAPFEQALDKLLETGEAQVDHAGLLIYQNAKGEDQSFVSTLKLYIEIITIYCNRHNITYDFKPLTVFQNRMFESLGFDEEEIQAAKVSINIAKQIVIKIKPDELFSILNTVRIGLNIEKNTQISLKDPEMALYSLKYKAGDLTYEEVLEKNKQFQERALEVPDNEHIVNLRDFYAEFLAAYTFYNRQQIGKI